MSDVHHAVLRAACGIPASRAGIAHLLGVALVVAQAGVATMEATGEPTTLERHQIGRLREMLQYPPEHFKHPEARDWTWACMPAQLAPIWRTTPDWRWSKSKCAVDAAIGAVGRIEIDAMLPKRLHLHRADIATSIALAADNLERAAPGASARILALLDTQPSREALQGILESCSGT